MTAPGDPMVPGDPMAPGDPTAEADDWDPLGAARLRVRVIWLVMALIGVLAVGAVYGHRLVEDDIDTRATRALEAAGFDEVEVDLTGRQVTLSGSVPTPADAEAAVETVDAIAGVDGVIDELRTGVPAR